MPTFPPNVTFTSRLQLPRPGLDDVADGPDGFNDLTDVLDPIAAVYSQGTLAARPAAGIAGRFYWATDARAIYYDDGTAWRSAAGTSSVGAALPILDVGMAGQNRAGRQLTVADFTSLGLAQPIGLWNLSDLTNLGSDGRALANKGAVPFGVGINGLAATAAVFAGSASQALYIPDSGATDPFRIRTGSWGCWFRTAKSGVAQDLLTKAGASTNYAYLLLIPAGSTTLVSYAGPDGSTLWNAGGVSNVCDDRWHFGVATADGTMLRLYVDGLLEAAVAGSGALFASPGPLNIGGRAADAGTATTEPHYGRIDEAFITADILTEDQVRCLYAAKLTHTLGATPTGVRLNVHRRRKGATLAVTDFTTQPLRLHNLGIASAPPWFADEGSNGVALTQQAGGGLMGVAGADGRTDNALTFFGGTHMAATDAGLPSGTAARSYGCWFKTTNASAVTNQEIIAWGTAGTADARLTTFSGFLYCQSAADTIGAGPFVADGQWHFVIEVEDNAAGDGVRRKLYLDGRLVGGSTVLNSIGGAQAQPRFRIGAHSDGTWPFTGQIDAAFVTGYALGQDDVLRLWAKGAQDLGASPKNPGDHVERLDASSVLFIGDTLESQSTVDLGVVA